MDQECEKLKDKGNSLFK